MGNALGIAAQVALAAVQNFMCSLRSGDLKPNPTIAEIEKRDEEVQRALEETKRIKEVADEEVQQALEETKRMKEVADEEVQQALEETKRMKEVADEEVQQALEETKRMKEAADEEIKRATEDAKSARAAQEEAERKHRQGIQPVVMPSLEELRQAKKKMQYKEGLFHFAVAGIAGGGKSSLMNAFCGLRNKDKGACGTGVVETTLEVARFPDPNRQNPFVWYDIPGAGTLNISDWQYFNTQGLYIFDCIIILFDNRFTTTDIAILMNSARFQIPTYIVRSKADAHIHNIMKENGYDSDAEEDPSLRTRLYEDAREKYITETRASVKRNLQDAKLPKKRVYIVTNDVLFAIVKGSKFPKKVIDELELVKDLLQEAHARRCK